MATSRLLRLVIVLLLLELLSCRAVFLSSRPSAFILPPAVSHTVRRHKHLPPSQAVVQAQYEQVSRATFPGVLERIRCIGKEAAFFSLDTEFTGYKQDNRDEYFDTVQQRYIKKKGVAENYLVVQMGLSAFVWDAALGDYKAYTWNIHIYPSTLQSDRIFSCDAASLSFLRSHNLDFNQWLDGVPFLAVDQEASLRKQVEDQAEWDLKASFGGGKKPTRSPLDPNADAETVELHKRLSEALDDLKPGSAPFLLPQGMQWFRKKMVENTIWRHPRKANLWLEAVVPPVALSNGNETAAPTTPPTPLPFHQQQLQVRYVTNDERATCVNMKKSRAIAEIEEAAGAMRIIQVVKDSGRPLIGHNFLLDLLFLYSHFVKPTLPDTAMGFKNKLQQLFPPIYDTKVLAKGLGVADSQGDTNLEGLYKSEGGAEVELEGGEGNGGAAHEAGHDAFMTGVVFASLLRRARSRVGEEAVSGASVRSSNSMPSLAYAEEWAHKVFMRMTDVDTFELRNFKQVPDRSRVFHVRTQGTASLPLLQHRELREAFASLGPLQIKALGKHEAYVVFQDLTRPPPEVEMMKKLVVNLGSQAGGGLDIMTYEERRVALGILW
ncbi:ribonuclease parn [Nannochloropsis oceanica]